MTAGSGTSDQRLADRLPMARAVLFAKATAVAVVPLGAWVPIGIPWRVAFPVLMLGGSLACLVVSWRDRGFRRNPAALYASFLAWGATR